MPLGLLVGRRRGSWEGKGKERWEGKVHHSLEGLIFCEKAERREGVCPIGPLVGGRRG